MKKILAGLLALMLMADSAFAESETNESEFVPTDSSILVACFSATGNTWPLAEYAAEYLNADLFRIEPEDPYTDADLNYNNNNSRANREMEDDTCRPAPAATVENIDQYDTVILAFPICWGQAPRIIESFIEAHDLSGKTVLCFCTSGGSGYGRTDAILSALTDDTVTWLEGHRFSPRTSAEQLRKWLQDMNITPYAAK